MSNQGLNAAALIQSKWMFGSRRVAVNYDFQVGQQEGGGSATSSNPYSFNFL